MGPKLTCLVISLIILFPFEALEMYTGEVSVIREVNLGGDVFHRTNAGLCQIKREWRVQVFKSFI